jgi:predicted deacylase
MHRASCSGAGGIDDSFTPERVKDVAERLRNLSRAIGLLAGEVKSYGKLTTFSNFHWATSPHGGIFRPTVKCGNTVAEGEPIGSYYDLFGDERVVARAPASGIVLAILGRSSRRAMCSSYWSQPHASLKDIAWPKDITVGTAQSGAWTHQGYA